MAPKKKIPLKEVPIPTEECQSLSLEQKIILQTIRDNKCMLNKCYNYYPIHAKIIHNIYKDKIGHNQSLGFYDKEKEHPLPLMEIQKIIMKTFESTLLIVDEEEEDINLASINNIKDLDIVMVFLMIELTN